MGLCELRNELRQTPLSEKGAWEGGSAVRNNDLGVKHEGCALEKGIQK